MSSDINMGPLDVHHLDDIKMHENIFKHILSTFTQWSDFQEFDCADPEHNSRISKRGSNLLIKSPKQCHIIKDVLNGKKILNVKIHTCQHTLHLERCNLFHQKKENKKAGIKLRSICLMAHIPSTALFPP